MIYNQMDVVYDENGYAGLGGSVYFNTPDIAPTGTMTSEVYDTDNNLLASITKPREHICNRKQLFNGICVQ